MSFLEDIFLEDETEEARALERIIEGDEYEDLRESDEEHNSEEEAEEEKRRIDTPKEKTKRVIKNPRFTLNPSRLTGPRGIQIIPEHFKDFKFKGKGHEKEDLDIVLKRLEHWAYRLYPKFKFEDCLKKIEILGKKRPVMVHLHKIRSDQISSDEPVIQNDSSDEEANVPEEDEFDKLLQQQIDIARFTPITSKPGIDKEITSSPLLISQATPSPSMSNEQRERMMRNRQLALERRYGRVKQNNEDSNLSQNKADSNNEIRNESGTITDSTQMLNTTMKRNDHTNNHHLLNQKDEVSSCNEIISQDIDNQINSPEADSTANKENECVDKESNSLNNKCSNSNVKVISIHIPTTNNSKHISYNTNECIINNTQITSAETNRNRNKSSEVNIPNNNNVFNMEVVSVDVHQIEGKGNRIHKFKAGDIFINSYEHVIDNNLLNLIDGDENRYQCNNNNSNDHDHDTVVAKHNETLTEENNDVEMMDDEGLSITEAIEENE